MSNGNPTTRDLPPLLRDEKKAHLILFRLVWTTRRLKPLLAGQVGAACRNAVETICNEYGWQPIEIEVKEIHINLLIRVWPTDSALGVLKRIRRVTKERLLAAYPKLTAGLPGLWSSNYLVSTDPDPEAAVVGNFIAAQKRD